MLKKLNIEIKKKKNFLYNTLNIMQKISQAKLRHLFSLYLFLTIFSIKNMLLWK